MGLIRRNFKYMDQRNFILLFRSMVRPHLEYATVTWSPILKNDIQPTQNVQQRATRYIPVINNLIYKERFGKLDLQTLKYRRFREDSRDIWIRLGRFGSKFPNF